MKFQSEFFINSYRFVFVSRIVTEKPHQGNVIE